MNIIHAMDEDPGTGQQRRKFLFFWALATIILLVAFWLRVNDLDQFPPGITVDEGMNVLEAIHGDK